MVYGKLIRVLITITMTLTKADKPESADRHGSGVLSRTVTISVACYNVKNDVPEHYWQLQQTASRLIYTDAPSLTLKLQISFFEYYRFHDLRFAKINDSRPQVGSLRQVEIQMSATYLWNRLWNAGTTDIDAFPCFCRDLGDNQR